MLTLHTEMPSDVLSFRIDIEIDELKLETEVYIEAPKDTPVIDLIKHAVKTLEEHYIAGELDE